MISFVRKCVTAACRLLLAFGVLLIGARAADVPPSQPAAPSGDPFIKKDVSPPTNPGQPSANVIFTVETYNVGMDDVAKLLAENKDNESRFNYLLGLQKTGRAHLENILSGACTSGEQATIEMSTLMRYAINFDTTGKTPVVTDLKGRTLGYRLVYKGQTPTDGKAYDMVLFYEHARFAGFDQQTLADGTVPQPRFASARMDVKTLLPFGEMQLLGTPSFEPKIASPYETTLAFGKIDVVPIEPSQPMAKAPASLTSEFSVYSVPLRKAADIMNEKQKTESAYQAVQSLVKSGEAKLERQSIITTQPGVKAGTDEVTEITYPVVFGRAEFVTQDVGFRGELEPDFIGGSQTLFLRRITTNWTRHLGDLQGQTIVPKKGDRPVFGVSELQTAIKAALGDHEFIGTFTPAFGSGLDEPKADGRVWLEFVRVTAANP